MKPEYLFIYFLFWWESLKTKTGMKERGRVVRCTHSATALVLWRIPEMPNVSFISIQKTQTEKATLLRQYSTEKIVVSRALLLFSRGAFC